MYILAIDTSFRKIGWAILDTSKPEGRRRLIDYGTIWVRAKGSVQRMNQIKSRLQYVIQRHRPLLAVIEKAESFTYNRSYHRGQKPLNQKAMQKHNISLGLITSVCLFSGLDIRYLSPLEWKGFQNKETTRTYVNEHFETTILKSHHDESDAIKMGSRFIDCKLEDNWKRQEVRNG